MDRASDQYTKGHVLGFRLSLSVFFFLPDARNYKKGPHVFHAFSIFRLLSVYISFSYMQFSTNDNDSDLEQSKVCAILHRGARWYRGSSTGEYAYCHNSNLNGQYGGKHKARGLVWLAFREFEYSLKHTEMKLKSKTQQRDLEWTPSTVSTIQLIS